MEEALHTAPADPHVEPRHISVSATRDSACRPGWRSSSPTLSASASTPTISGLRIHLDNSTETASRSDRHDLVNTAPGQDAAGLLASGGRPGLVVLGVAASAGATAPTAPTAPTARAQHRDGLRFERGGRVLSPAPIPQGKKLLARVEFGRPLSSWSAFDGAHTPLAPCTSTPVSESQTPVLLRSPGHALYI